MRAPWRTAVLACGLVSIIASGAMRSSAAPSAGGAVLRTLAVVPGGIQALAQDGDRLAWVPKSCRAQHAGTQDPVTVLDLTHKRTTALRGPCSIGWRGTFALAGSRVAWLADTHWSSTELNAELLTASVARPSARVVFPIAAFYDFDTESAPQLWVQLAGRRATLAASISGSLDIDAGSRGWGMWSIDQRGRARRLSEDPAELVAVTSTRVAALRNTADPDVKSVSIIDARTGEEVFAVDIDGHPKAVALSAWSLAVVIGDSIHLYSASTGTDQGTVQLPAKPDQISIFSHTIVFAAGRAVYRLDTRTHIVSLLATARQTPVGLSIDGARVIWAENSAGRARIQSIVAR